MWLAGTRRRRKGRGRGRRRGETVGILTRSTPASIHLSTRDGVPSDRARSDGGGEVDGSGSCTSRDGAWAWRCVPRVLPILGAMSVDVRGRGRIGAAVSSEWTRRPRSGTVPLSSQRAVRACGGRGAFPAEDDTHAGKLPSKIGHSTTSVLTRVRRPLWMHAEREARGSGRKTVLEPVPDPS